MTSARDGMKELIEYLRRLAPRFFAERMRGASADQIDSVEQAAGARLTDSHREFLAACGMTPAQALNPFLTDRDFGVPALLRAYEEWSETTEETGDTLPPGVVVFSNSDILGEYIYLRHEARLDIDPEIGDIDPETGELGVKPERHLLNFFQYFAFTSRRSQGKHILELVPYWDAERERFFGDADATWQLLMQLGLEPVFSFEDGSRCADGGALAAVVQHDGSGMISGDDMKYLRRAGIVLHRSLARR